jgi:hypothetical protein
VPVAPVLGAPPVEQRFERLALRFDGPVELGHERVDPALAEPAPAVGVQALEGVESLDARRVLGAPDPERADGEDRAGPPGVHQFGGVADERVDVGAAPVLEGQAPPVGVPVRAESAGVGERAVVARVGVEVVVHVDAVDGVAREQVVGDAEGLVAGVGFSGIEPEVGAVFPDEVGAFVGEVGGRVASDALGVADAEGVDPGVQVHPGAVRGVEPVAEGVVARDGGASLPPGEEGAPGLEA